MVEIRERILQDIKVDEVFSIRLTNGERHTGRLVEVRPSDLIIEEVVAFWNRSDDKKTWSPMVAYETYYFDFEDIAFYIRL